VREGGREGGRGDVREEGRERVIHVNRVLAGPIVESSSRDLQYTQSAYSQQLPQSITYRALLWLFCWKPPWDI